MTHIITHTHTDTVERVPCDHMTDTAATSTNTTTHTHLRTHTHTTIPPFGIVGTSAWFHYVRFFYRSFEQIEIE